MMVEPSSLPEITFSRQPRPTPCISSEPSSIQVDPSIRLWWPWSIWVAVRYCNLTGIWANQFADSKHWRPRRNGTKYAACHWWSTYLYTLVKFFFKKTINFYDINWTSAIWIGFERWAPIHTMTSSFMKLITTYCQWIYHTYSSFVLSTHTFDRAAWCQRQNSIQSFGTCDRISWRRIPVSKILVIERQTKSSRTINQMQIVMMKRRSHSTQAISLTFVLKTSLNFTFIVVLLNDFCWIRHLSISDESKLDGAVVYHLFNAQQFTKTDISAKYFHVWKTSCRHQWKIEVSKDPAELNQQKRRKIDLETYKTLNE